MFGKGFAVSLLPGFFLCLSKSDEEKDRMTGILCACARVDTCLIRYDKDLREISILWLSKNT